MEFLPVDYWRHWRACRVPCQEQESPTCAPDRPSKILLVQVWTLSSSPIPPLGCLFSFYPLGCPFSFFHEYPMRERSPVPCAQPSPRGDAPSPLAFAKSCKGGDVSVLDPALAWDVRCIYLFIATHVSLLAASVSVPVVVRDCW